MNPDDEDIKEEEETKNGSPNRDPNWDKNYENTDITDDPVRMHLREIGRVSLLKAADDRTLAHRIEAYKHVEVVGTELKESQGTTPRACMFVQQFLKSICESQELVHALSRYITLDGKRTLNSLVSDAKIREVLDRDLPEEMFNFIAEILNIEPDQAKADIRKLALNTRLLPKEILDNLRSEPTRAELESMADTQALKDSIEFHDNAIQGHVDHLKGAGQSHKDTLLRPISN